MKTKTALHLFASTLILLLFVSCGPSERKQLEKEGWNRYGEFYPTYYNDEGKKQSSWLEYSIYYKTDIINGTKYIAVRTDEISQPYIIEWWYKIVDGESITRKPLIEGPFLVNGEVYGWKFASGDYYLNFD